MNYYGNRYNWTGPLKEKLRAYYGPYGGAVRFSKETEIPLSAVYKMAESMGLRQTPKHWYINYQGYKVVGKSEERKAEHRAVMEGMLGRALKVGEVVHHLDGDKLNNVPENLVITTRSEHMNLHRKELHLGDQHPDNPC